MNHMLVTTDQEIESLILETFRRRGLLWLNDGTQDFADSSASRSSVMPRYSRMYLSYVSLSSSFERSRRSSLMTFVPCLIHSSQVSRLMFSPIHDPTRP